MSRLDRIYRQAKQEAIPVEVMIELTHHCNFRCQHCYIPDFTAPDALSTERVLELLDELSRMGTLLLALSGGELFLRRDWEPIACQARELGFDLHLFSNAFLIGDEEAKRIASLDATMQVSLYSMDAEVFDDITRRPGSFERVIDGIERLRARDVRVILKMPVMTVNSGSVAAVEEYAAEIGAECQWSPFISAKKDGDLEPLSLRMSQEAIFGELGGPVTGCFDREDLDGPLCAAASRYCVITSSGDVMACNILPGSDANVRERSFRDVWENSPWLNRIRGMRRQDLDECAECDRLSYCGRCTAQALTEDGNLYGPSSEAQRRADLIDRQRSGSG